MEYNREKAVAYAHKWAFSRNKQYYNFDPLGGDCTNFISQCIHAGGAPMNYTRDTGWFYASLSKRAPAWTGVPYLHRFLTTNTGTGPYGSEQPLSMAEIGDVIQCKWHNIDEFSHSLIIVAINGEPVPSNILIAAHTDDSDHRRLDTYWYEKMRLIHIEGLRN